jgi:predicted transcriptional regulator
MGITIDLAPETFERLKEKAAREGRDAASVAAAVIAESLEWEAEDQAEAVEGIRRGLADFDEGRSRSLEEVAAGKLLAWVLTTIQEFGEDELRQVQQVVQDRLQHEDQADAFERLQQDLLASGLVKEIKPLGARATEEFPLVPIQGKPLSETIIEERR